MTGKLTLSFAAATFIAALAGLFLLRGLSDRVAKLEDEPAAEVPSKNPPLPAAGNKAAADSPMASTDPLVKLNWIMEKLDSMENDDYDYYKDISGEIYQMKRALTQIKVNVMKMRRAMVEGGKDGLQSTLPKPGVPLGGDDIKKLREAAAKFGVKVEDGRVTVRGFLNMAPNKTMPIEYFMTRYPEAGHETLVHLLGNKSLEELRERPFDGARGLPTALYKGLVAAGFKQGEPFRPDPESDRMNPTWLLPTGDKVYIYVRFELDGESYVLSATDWVLDPTTGKPIPEDCFHFTGSRRREDIDTGDEIITAEMMGLLVSVWPNQDSIVEIGLQSAVANRYTYNPSAMPDMTGRELLSLDVIFTKAPIETKPLPESLIQKVPAPGAPAKGDDGAKDDK